MTLMHRRVDNLTEATLNELILGGVVEGKEIDFKRDTYGNSDSDKREFLADVSSFANTAGGHIVIGMDEVQGVASNLCGIAADPDTERLRLEQIARNGLQPRITGLQIVAVRLGNGRNAVVVRIPRSWNPPHRVIAQNNQRFYSRGSGGKFEPDVEQLRDLFQVAPSIAEKIRDFRMVRIGKIVAHETPRPLLDGGALVLHIAPFAAFGAPVFVSAADLLQAQEAFRPIGAMDFTPKLNLDGLVATTGGRDGNAHPAYIQVWRDGRIETARAPLVREPNGTRVVSSNKLEGHLVDATISYISGLRRLGIEPPYAVLVSLTDVNGASLDMPEWIDDDAHIFDRDIVTVSEVLIAEPVNDDRDVPLLLRPIFDDIANAAGRFASRNFDANGQWRRQR